MNERQFVKKIQEQINKDSLTTSCGGEGCKVDMADIPRSRVIIHVENEFDFRKMTQKRCDRLLFFINTEKSIVAVPIELKSGKAPESDVVEKLENSLKFASDIIKNMGILEFESCPILFHARGLKLSSPRSPSSLKQELRIQFQGKRRQILIGKCGQKKNLAQLLISAGYLPT